MKTPRRQIELFDNQRMKQAGQVGAGRHPHAGPGFFDRAGAADPFAASRAPELFAGASQIGRAGQTIMPGANNQRRPRSLRGKLHDRRGQTHQAESLDRRAPRRELELGIFQRRLAIHPDDGQLLCIEQDFFDAGLRSRECFCALPGILEKSMSVSFCNGHTSPIVGEEPGGFRPVLLPPPYW